MRALWLFAVLGAFKLIAAIALFAYIARSWLPLLLLPAFLLVIVVIIRFSRNSASAKA